MGAPASRAAAPQTKGYLTSRQLPDSVALIGPPPAEGSGALAGDLATYKATRSLVGSPRWALAAHDANLSATALMGNFSCAVGVALDRRRAPSLFRLFDRAGADAEAVGQLAKNAYQRPRPFVQNGGSICVADQEWLRKSYSYPSGHSTYSWTAALILGTLAPDRASEIFSRARSYGESRVVCGVHYQSDVQAGRVAASAVFSALEASRAFRSDLAQARQELARLRRSSSRRPDPAECAVEAEASARPIW